MVPTIFYAACAIAAAGLALLLMQSGKKFRMGASILGLAGIAWILVIIIQKIPTPASEFGPLGLMIFCAFISVASAVRVITHHRPVFCALYFVLVVVSGAMGNYVSRHKTVTDVDVDIAFNDDHI